MSGLTGKRVLITGARHDRPGADPRLADEGVNVIALDLPGAPNAQEILDGIAPGVRYFGCDLNDLAELEKQSTALAVFLPTSQADLITGQNILVDGGW